MWVGCASNQDTSIVLRRWYNQKEKGKEHAPTESSFSIKDYHKDSKLFPEKLHRRNKSNNIYNEGRKALISSAQSQNRINTPLKQTT